MNTILDIINKYRTQLNNGNFNGDIYFPDNNGKLQIDRAVFNKMLDKFNVQFDEPIFSPNDNDYFLSFKYEVFQKSESIWREDRNYYLATILTDGGVFSVWSEETTGYEKQPDHFDYIEWKDIEDIQVLDNNDGNFIIRFFIKTKLIIAICSQIDLVRQNIYKL